MLWKRGAHGTVAARRQSASLVKALTMGLSDKINGSSKLGQVARLTVCQVADQIEGVSVVTI